MLDEESKELQSGQNLSGDVAFKLYDTYGFPLDLTQEALRARKIGVDTDAFDAAMQRLYTRWPRHGQPQAAAIRPVCPQGSSRRPGWRSTDLFNRWKT